MSIMRFADFDMKYSNYKRLTESHRSKLIEELKENDNLFVKTISYCVMPTHYHLLLEQVKDNGIEKFISKMLNSYAKYFNLRHKRSGPLWSSRFKSVEVVDDEQLLHLTRYIHLNPTSAGYVNMPEDWQYSSYMEYISDDKHLCEYDHLLEIDKNQSKNL